MIGPASDDPEKAVKAPYILHDRHQTFCTFSRTLINGNKLSGFIAVVRTADVLVLAVTSFEIFVAAIPFAAETVIFVPIPAQCNSRKRMLRQVADQLNEAAKQNSSGEADALSSTLQYV